MQHDPALIGFMPWYLRGADKPLGYVTPEVADILATDGLMQNTGIRLFLNQPASLDEQLERVRACLCRVGLIESPRDEAMQVRFSPRGRVLARIDRSAMRILGLWATKVHVNGLMFSPEMQHPDVWLSRRSHAAAAAPNTYDTLVAGGHPHGATLRQTMIKESGEEVGLPAQLAGAASLTTKLEAIYTSPQGLHREQLVVFDLLLGCDFQPVHSDGEISESVRFSWLDFCSSVTDGRSFKYSSLLVCRDLVARQVERGSPPVSE